MKVLIIMNNTLSGYLRELKNKGKVQLRELFITKYESHPGGTAIYGLYRYVPL